ncbi:cupredoxin family copper-binding protein [Paraburkholderia sp. MMS20-SJTN17]|uniref:Cupredoxin family copper-binding protein n=1 Tax=Paraburkholderia translucens TaxID=2886945 RepID=A0ABS8K6Q8_9BURK|nr:cupredoxin family copper-binding protein [Paraburkholderia sp. MMS20-SJTN17]MCC8400367.1 cupredoxin family copper-binding protein [Paraburkholderia sp. MMS20-SJTN17]
MLTNRIGRALVILPASLAILAVSAELGFAQTTMQMQMQMPMKVQKQTVALAPNEMVMKNFAFAPTDLAVKAGTTVTWKNLDGEPHTVVNEAGLFRSGALDQNDTFQFKFDKPGVYKIFCGIHPNMRATITVQ